MNSSDMVPAVYGGGKYLRRWSLISGFPRCVLPPLVISESTAAEIVVTEERNALVYSAAVAVEDYESALQESQAPMPDKFIAVDGVASPNPAYVSWLDAVTAVGNAAPETLALAALRNSEITTDPVVLAVLSEDNVVIDVVAVDAGGTINGNVVPAPTNTKLGSAYANGTFIPPTHRIGFPKEVSLRQLLFALVASGWITETEALAAAMTGAIPSSLEAMLPGLTEQQAFALRLTWASMYSAERSSPIWTLFEQFGVATPDDVDNLFRIAGQVGA